MAWLARDLLDGLGYAVGAGIWVWALRLYPGLHLKESSASIAR